MNAPREHVPNNLVWAVLTTILCCLPFGIVSIIYASKVDGLALAGDTQGARLMADRARNWAIAAAVTPAVLIVLWFLFFGGMAVLGSLGSGTY